MSNYDSISMTLAPKHTTIQYNASAINTPTAVKSTQTGTILDHNYSFEVERVAEQGQRAQIGGASYATKLVQTLITYEVEYEFRNLAWYRPTLQDHLDAIEDEIGIPITLIGANFYPKTDINIALRHNPLDPSFYEVLSGTWAEIMSRLLGWSNDVPGKTYNIYITTGHIYIIQQGHETATRTVPAWATRPTITHTVRHTEWANSQSSILPKEISSSDAYESNKPYSGTITWGSTELTYDDGYLVQEKRGDDGQGGATLTTNYYYTTYGDAKYLTRKETTDTEEDTLVTTEYDYEQTDKDLYLFEERTAEYSGASTQTPIKDKETLIRHVPVGGGWYGTTTYDTTGPDEEELSNSLSQGAPGNKASQYLIDEANDSLKDNQSPRQMKVALNGVAKARQQYPVADLVTLRAIATALDTYEGAEEITIQGEVVGGTHLYNYNDKIVYNGNEYYLISNQVTRTPGATRQNITATRWVTQP